MSAYLQPPCRGEIWYAFTPGQPRDPHQPRPVLIISEDIRNASRSSRIVVPVFSRGRTGPTRVPLSAGMGGLSHDSVLFCEEVTTIYIDYFEDGPLGEPISSDLIDWVVRAVRRAIGDVVPEPSTVPDDGS